MITEQEFQETIILTDDVIEKINLLNNYSWDIRRSYPKKSLALALEAREASMVA